MDTEEVKNVDDNNEDEEKEEGGEALSLLDKLLNEHEQIGFERGKHHGILLGEAMALTEVAQKLVWLNRFTEKISLKEIADICKLSLERVQELAAK